MFYRTGEICFKWLLSLTVLPRAVLEPNQKSMMELFVKLINDFQLLTVFAKTPP